MKKAKLAKTEKKHEIKMETNEYSLKSLVKIVIILILIFGVFYLITTFVVKPATNEKVETPDIVEFDFTKITMNQLLNRKEDEYFVLATKKSNISEINSNINYKNIYNQYIEDYSKKEKSLPFYYVDLDDALNKYYVGDETNISKNLTNLTVNQDVLFRIKNGKINKYYVGSDKIIEQLSNLKED